MIFNSEMIGLAGYRGTVHCVKGGIGCYLQLPLDHPIFNTEDRWQDILPVGKCGDIDIQYNIASPCQITYWNRMESRIGWFTQTTVLSELFDEIKAMSHYLDSEAAKTEIIRLYEHGP